MPPNWQPRPGVCEIENLRDALLAPLLDVAHWLRQRFIDAPVASEDPTVIATVRSLRALTFDRLIARLTP